MFSKRNYDHTHLPYKIELEITTDCNLRCLNCDRSCRQAPSSECMTLDQVKRFVAESLEFEHKWSKIVLLGGEPTLHPDLLEMIDAISQYKIKNRYCRVAVYSNGFTEESRAMLTKLPGFVRTNHKVKTSAVNKFNCYNVAPVDYGLKATFCDIPWRCGCALTRYGYFPCGAGAALARVYGFDIGVKKLQDLTVERFFKQLAILCQYCGHAPTELRHSTTQAEMSKSWVEAYAQYKVQKPNLTLY